MILDNRQSNQNFSNNFGIWAPALLRNRLQATSRVEEASSMWHGAEIPPFLEYLSLNKMKDTSYETQYYNSLPL
jgi:hypothetical protein